MADPCSCGCCEGAHTHPTARANTPGASAIAYRVRAHAEFKAALLASLSRADQPALGALHTRRDDDFTIAMCDAAAMLLDVLTFYQERYANEFYLRTAVERRSLIDLARLIGYRPSPGVGAGTRLAFLLEQAPGAPALAAEPVTIPIGTRVQSVPGPGEQPQTFETVEEVTARVDWNAIPVQTTEYQSFAIGTTDVFVSGITTPLQPGDVVLIVGDERLDPNDLDTNIWDARVIETVERDNARDRTRLTFAEGLGRESPARAPAALNPRAYVFRQRTALFGHNAPDPVFLYFNVTVFDNLPVTGSPGNWEDWLIGTTIDIDGSHPKILPGTWVLLTGGEGGDSGVPALPGFIALYRASFVQHMTLSKFALNGRITRIWPDTQWGIGAFDRRITAGFAQSEELPLTRRPLAYPLYGSEVSLEGAAIDLVPEQEVAIGGRRQRLRILVDKSTLEFQPESAAAFPVKPNDSFTIAGPPVQVVSTGDVAVAPQDLPTAMKALTATLRWTLIDRNDVSGTLETIANDVELQPAANDDPIVRELCVIASADTDEERTTLQLDAPLANVYDRATTTVCANVARATHGEAVSEIAGSGNAAAAGQRFQLKQAPLTYVSASTAEGRASTLEVRVNDLLWEEVETLFEQSSDARVYALRQDGDNNTIVQFGDGVEGQRLPTGRDNIRFSYRKSLGSAGNLDDGRLTTLLGRPLGVKAVTNVTDATGGEDAETIDDLRENAPLTMLTLGRAVSLQDYTDFARTFAGVARAKATWTGGGATRGIFISVAGPDGDPVEATSDTMVNLIDALRDYGDELIPLTVDSYAAVSFGIQATIKIADDAEEDTVLTAVEEALQTQYAFDARDFDQNVSIDEVMAVIHGVTGVEAVDVDALYRLDPNASPSLNARLFAFPAQADTGGTVTPAEILTLDSGALTLGVML